MFLRLVHTKNGNYIDNYISIHTSGRYCQFILKFIKVLTSLIVCHRFFLCLVTESALGEDLFRYLLLCRDKRQTVALFSYSIQKAICTVSTHFWLCNMKLYLNHYFPDIFDVVWFTVSERVHVQVFIAGHRHTSLVRATSLQLCDVTPWGSSPKPDPMLPQYTSKWTIIHILLALVR